MDQHWDLCYVNMLITTLLIYSVVKNIIIYDFGSKLESKQVVNKGQG